MSWKKSKNFVYGRLLGSYTTTNSVIYINTNSGTLFSTASTNSSYNVVIWNYTSSKDPASSTNTEICSITSKLTTNSFKVVRAQEGTSATAKGSGSTFRVMQDFSKVEKNQIEDYLYPVGSVLAVTFTNTPTKWVQCNGTEIYKTSSEYASLYSLIGTRFNYPGTPSNKFRIPGVQYQVLMHINTSDTSSSYPKGTIGAVNGWPFHQLTINEMPMHGNGHVASVSTDNVFFNMPPTTSTDMVISVTTTNSGYNGTHNNLQPYLILQYIIKYKN